MLGYALRRLLGAIPTLFIIIMGPGIISIIDTVMN